MNAIYIWLFYLSFPNRHKKFRNAIIANPINQILYELYILIFAREHLSEFFIGHCKYRIFTIFGSIHN